jgi:hypothetical protein
LKRSIDQITKSAKFRSREDEQLQAIQEGLRQDLERPQLWGDGAADLQVQRNRAYHSKLSLEQAKDLDPRRTVLTDARGVPSANENNYKPLHEGDLGGVLSTLKGAGKAEGEQALWKLGEVAERRAKLGDALTDHIDPNEVQRNRAAEMGRSATAIKDRLAQRTQEAEAAQALSRTEQNLPDPGMGTRALQWLAGKGEQTGLGKAISDVSPTPRNLGSRARQIGQLENQLTQNPGNKLAQEALDRLSYRIDPASPFKQGVANSMALGSSREAATDASPNYVSDALKTAFRDQDQSKSQGHELEGTITQVLEQDPTALGEYAERLQAAKSNGNLGAELYRLSGDPRFRVLKSRFQPATE